MAYYPYTIMISIIYLSYYQFIQTFADSVDIEGSSYKLSTDIHYAIYESNSKMNDYLYDAQTNGGDCATAIYNYNVTDPVGGDFRAEWKIEKTNYGYAIKNVATDRYLSRSCGNMVSAQTMALTPSGQETQSWKFNWVKESYPFQSKSLPVVNIQSPEQFKSAGHHGITTNKWANLQCASNDAIQNWKNAPNGISLTPPSDCSDPSQWVFIPIIPIKISITACNHWDHGSISKSMTIRLNGAQGSSEYFYVNQHGQLPTNGAYETYTNIISNNPGDLYSIQLSVDDPSFGYCVKSVDITYNDKTYSFGSDGYFGSGLILANDCKYNYQWLHQKLPLIKCITGSLELKTYEKRGIYPMTMHSCIGNDNGMDVTKMKENDNVYATIMGKKENDTSYTTTEITYLDHYVPGDFNLRSVGDLIAGNVKLVSNAINALYSPIVGNLIGIKLEIVDYPNNKFDAASTISIKIDETDVSLGFWRSSLEDGRYLIQFFLEQAIKKSTEIYIYGGDKTNIDMNIYAIFKGKEVEYGLPFIVESNDNGALDWFEANDDCNMKYGTTLASIHSEDQNKLIAGFTQNPVWIGLFDNAFEKQDNWQWIDGSAQDVTYWSPNQLDNFNGEDCGFMQATYGIGEWDDSPCSEPFTSYVCSSPQWPSNTERKFEINVAEKIDDITLISIGNNAKDDTLCLDSVSINDKAATYLSTNKFGGNTGSPSLNAIIKYPVCKTEVTNVRMDVDNSESNLIPGDSQISGMECKNNNRMIPSTCSISQSYDFTTVTSVSISNENSETNEYSWGSETEFSFGMESSMTVGGSYTGGTDGTATSLATVSAEVSVGMNTQFTSSTNRQATQSSETTSGQESSWESSETTTVECNAEIEVPPSHSIKYSLIFDKINTTINTYTDLKLTLCSAYTSPTADEDDPSHYKIIENIPGVIEKQEVTSCVVNFSPADYNRNDLKCHQEQKLAISTGSTYVPRCKSDDAKAELYDPCQCDIGDSRTLAQCWCVDETGNPEPGKLSYVEGETPWQKVCVEDLKCANSIAQSTTTTASVSISPSNPQSEDPTLEPTRDPTSDPTDDPAFEFRRRLIENELKRMAQEN